MPVTATKSICFPTLSIMYEQPLILTHQIYKATVTFLFNLFYVQQIDCSILLKAKRYELCLELNHGPLEPKASVIPLSYADHFNSEFQLLISHINSICFKSQINNTSFIEVMLLLLFILLFFIVVHVALLLLLLHESTAC